MMSGTEKEKQIRRMRELIPILGEASRAYYQESREIMSDRAYDALYDELLDLERKSGIVLSGSPTQKVGYETVTNLPKKRHPAPMLSQNKTKSVEELQNFLGDQSGLLSWKMDGLTVVLTYENGRLSEAVTRGNGEVGAIVTANARTFRNIPLRIDFQDTLIVRGEAVIRYDDFEEINRSLPEDGPQYKNPRNLCSGSVLQLSSAVTASRRVRLYVFSLVTAGGRSFASRHEELDFVRSLGFETVEYRFVDRDSLPDAVAAFKQDIAQYPIPSDGLVLLMDDVEYGKSLGTTAKYPRDSIAFKWADEIERTHLRRIEWSASRTGLINPVAIFDPVELEGTSVSRASVHNLSVMKELALGEGDEIGVYKANMIIPQIAENYTRSDTIRPPKTCPVCGHATVVHESGEAQTLYCTNPECPARQIKKFDLFVSRNAMNIDGLSEMTLEKLIDIGAVREFADLFRLGERKEEIVQLEGFGEKSFENLLEAAKNASKTNFVRLITGLGISNVGPATARTLSRYFHADLDALRKADAASLQAVPDIGPVVAEGIAAFFADPAHGRELDELLRYLTLEEENAGGDEGKATSLAGLTFVITGSLEHFSNRDALKTRIEDRGGKVAGSVSSKTTALINNDAASPSAKNQTAKKLGVAILTEEAFLKQYFPDETF